MKNRLFISCEIRHSFEHPQLPRKILSIIPNTGFELGILLTKNMFLFLFSNSHKAVFWVGLLCLHVSFTTAACLDTCSRRFCKFCVPEHDTAECLELIIDEECLTCPTFNMDLCEKIDYEDPHSCSENCTHTSGCNPGM